jgi:hypothetical protein
VLTLLVVTALGLWASRGHALTAETLVSAPGELGAPVLTASLVATNPGVGAVQPGGGRRRLRRPPRGDRLRARRRAPPAGVRPAAAPALPASPPRPLPRRVRSGALRPPNGRLLLAVSTVSMFVFLTAELTGAAALRYVAGVPG